MSDFQNRRRGPPWTSLRLVPTTPPPFPFPDQPPLEFHSAEWPGIAALILGIMAVAIPFLYWSDGIFGIVGLILGFIGRAAPGEATNGTMALVIITSAVVVVLSIVELVFLIMGSEWRWSSVSGSSGGRHLAGD